MNEADSVLGANKDLDEHHTAEQSAPPKIARVAVINEAEAERIEDPKPNEPEAAEPEPPVLEFSAVDVHLPVKPAVLSIVDQSSESDEEELDDYFEAQIPKVEAELKGVRSDILNTERIHLHHRYLSAVHGAMIKITHGGPNLTAMIGPIPQGYRFETPEPSVSQPTTEEPPEVEEPSHVPPETTREESAIPTVETGDDMVAQPSEPQPKVEEMDTEGSGLPPLPTIEEARPQDEDVDMQDVAEEQPADAPFTGSEPVPGVIAGGDAITTPNGQTGSGRNTPSGADEDSEDRTDDEASIYESLEAVREFSATPPVEDLPTFNVKPWYQSRRVRKQTEVSPEFASFFSGQIADTARYTLDQQAALKEDYSKKYEEYLRFTMSDDPAAVKSRDYFAHNGMPTTSNGRSSNHHDKPEGSRRAGRFSTELDVEYAIKQSMKEHQEKQEREARAQKEKYRSEKEAVIPDMFSTPEEKTHSLFYDTAGLVPLEKLVATWQVSPWHVNFTEEEAAQFEKAYLENPKQWGKIAKDIPSRDFRACIQYYYAKKRELNLKEKLKKQPRRRKKGRGKQRSSALVSELGNQENENEEPQENGENGERRRPRRAAAPTWGYEATPAVDSDGATPAATPGRKRAGAAAEAKNDSGAEKTEVKKGGRRTRQPKADKEAKAPKPAQTLAPTPPAALGKANRSRSNSRAQQGPEWMSPQTPADLGARLPAQFEGPPGGMQPPMVPVQQPSLASPERAPPPMQSTISEVMAPPSLRPEPPPPPVSVPTFDISQPSGSGHERTRSSAQASSYWSVSESTDFPLLLRHFGTDWGAIAGHMQTKTAVMVSLFNHFRQFSHASFLSDR